MPKFQNAANLQLQKYIIRRKHWWQLRDACNLQKLELEAQSSLGILKGSPVMCFRLQSVFFPIQSAWGNLKECKKKAPCTCKTWPLHFCLGLLGLIASYWDHRASGMFGPSLSFSPPRAQKFEARAACQVAECLNWSRMSWGKECSDSFHAQTHKPKTYDLKKLSTERWCKHHLHSSNSATWVWSLQQHFHQGDTTQFRRRRNSCSACCSFPWSLAKHCQVGHKCLQVIFSQTESRTAKHSAKLLRQCKVSAWPGLGQDEMILPGGSSSKSRHEPCGFFQGSDPNDRRNMQRPSQCKSMSNHRQDNHRSLEVRLSVERFSLLGLFLISFH